eukprot:9486134-Pyramimonas_sp.AAC.1
MDEVEILETSSLNQPNLLTTKITNAKGSCEFRVYLGSLVVVTNTGNSELVLREGLVIAGFGKVGWKRLNEADSPSAKEIPVVFDSSENVVIMGTQMVTIKAAVEERRTQNPSVSVCYHSIEPNAGPANPGSFKLVVKDRVVCTLSTSTAVEEQDGAEPTGRVRATQSNAANTLPLDIWKSTGIAKMVWNMRWVQSGLMPQRPQAARHSN